MIVLVFLFIFDIIATTQASDYDVDATVKKTMEDFSGFPIHEPRSVVSDHLSSLSVEAQSLQSQVEKTYSKRFPCLFSLISYHVLIGCF